MIKRKISHLKSKLTRNSNLYLISGQELSDIIDHISENNQTDYDRMWKQASSGSPGTFMALEEQKLLDLINRCDI